MITESANLPDSATWTWFDRDTTREDEAEDAARVVKDWEDGEEE
jgi:hypothetical protein